MALEIKLSQKLSQTLVMTPQLQQAIKLLQLGRQEYLDVLGQELLENPVLEELREEESSARIEKEQAGESYEAATATNDSAQPSDFQEIRGALSDIEYQSESYWSGRSANQFYDGDESMPSLEASVSSKEGLTSHLLWQLRTSDLEVEDEEIAATIIGNLDRNGYLSVSLEEISLECRCDVSRIEKVLLVVQSLDPVGIAARDLRECLLIQAQALGIADTLLGKIVDKHLEKLELRRYEDIARIENVDVEAVYEAVREITKLEPRPGRPFIDEEPIYIVPDVYVRKVGEEYVIILNEAGIPKLRLNPMYRELFQKNGAEVAADKEYLQEKMRAAAWLIKSIHQRQQTIYKVTESIMKFQHEFLEHGVAHMRPLVLREIAETVGMHESTISRVTNNKYVHTPQGIFELKYFFSSGLKTDEGFISSESVKDRIKEMVAKENPKKPLSDQAIVVLLKQEGIDVARRTVAKYREMLGILSSSRRKKLF